MPLFQQFIMESEKNQSKNLYIALILIAGILWGSMGLFVRPLNRKNLSSWDIVFIRAILTTFFMAVLLLKKDINLFRVKLKDIWCFIGTGIFSIVFFNMCYFKEITIAPLSVAAILLYTAPAFVIVLSAICFKENITKYRVVSLLLSFAGLIFVTGVLGSSDRITFKTLMIGLGAGLGYALYSIFSRYALERGYETYTISFYTFLFASLSSAFFARPVEVVRIVTASTADIILVIIFALVSTVIPYLTYTTGLKRVENGQASIIASIEPVVASLIGIIWFHEKISLGVLVGIILVLAGIVISNIKK